MTNPKTLGDRMKSYEDQTCGVRLNTDKPIVLRLDGRGFSKFTRDLEKPFDERLARLMVDSTKHLVEAFSCSVGYTQSDEITLLLEKNNRQFDGKLFKMVSLAGSCMGAFFNRELPVRIPCKKDVFAMFDCRAYNVPEEDVANVFLWRQRDALKNSVSAAARAHYGHTEILGKNTEQKIEMLRQIGVEYFDYPDYLRHGAFVLSKTIEQKFSPEEIELLPPMHEARKNPEMAYVRRTLVVETSAVLDNMSVEKRKSFFAF